MNSRYMEVWNKVDLVKDMDWLNAKIDEDLAVAEYPIVLLSATEGFNKKVFLEEMSEMVANSLGKRKIELKYPAWMHYERVDWLFKFANINDPSNFTVDDEGLEITTTVMLDESIYMKWLKEFEPEKFEHLQSYQEFI